MRIEYGVNITCAENFYMSWDSKHRRVHASSKERRRDFFCSTAGVCQKALDGFISYMPILEYFMIFGNLHSIFTPFKSIYGSKV